MTVQQTGNQLAGTVSGQMGSAPMTGKVDGSKVDFAFTIEFGGNSIKVEQAGNDRAGRHDEGNREIRPVRRGYFPREEEVARIRPAGLGLAASQPWPAPLAHT